MNLSTCTRLPLSGSIYIFHASGQSLSMRRSHTCTLDIGLTLVEFVNL
uniref:Uncharacterized protein n=1 Tax=Arundo donax TaxID=35708 RepID=A0A0A8ZWC4_ARUDO